MTCGVQSTLRSGRSTMSELPKRLGKRIAAERELLGWSQVDLAERVGVAAETISRLERGVFDPSLARLESIASALGVALHDLLRFGSDSLQDRLIHRFLSAVAHRSGGDAEVAIAVL